MFKFPARIQLAALPTPIQKLERLSEQWGGPEIFVKRDDLTGMTLSGNKIRKLEFVIAEARDQDADLLITCGGIQSNHARATAVSATKLGMKSYLVLRGQEGGEADGNLLLDFLVGAKVKYITPEDYSTRADEIMADLAEDLKEEGHHPYVIPEGASTELGAIGYLAATEEIVMQLQNLKLQFDYLVCADGSGGTHAGLLLGQKFYHQKYQVVGINVCDDEAYFVDKISSISKKAIDRFDLDVDFKKEDVKIIDGYVGEGYALNRQEEIYFIKQVALTEGLILDPVYTGKALFGVRDQILKGLFKKGEKILFIHTGGLFGLFPKRALFFKNISSQI
jgi:D-cysteine desulfhydrase